MAGTERLVADAKRFAESYTPSDEDHPDLHSRVVMFRRAIDQGDKRAVAIHAKTLTRFLGHVGVEIPKAKKAPAKKAAGSRATGS